MSVIVPSPLSATQNEPDYNLPCTNPIDFVFPTAIYALMKCECFHIHHKCPKCESMKQAEIFFKKKSKQIQTLSIGALSYQNILIPTRFIGGKLEINIGRKKTLIGVQGSHFVDMNKSFLPSCGSYHHSR